VDKTPKQKFKSIRSSVLLHIAWRNFISKKLRSFLTVFGVVIGVTAIFFLFTFGLGVQRLVTNEVIGDQSLKAIDVNSPNSKIIQLDEDTINTIRTYPNVERVGVQFSFPGITALEGGEIDAVVYGLNIDYQNASSLVLVEGRLLEEADARSVVVNTAALESLGIESSRDALNKQVAITVPLDRDEAKIDKIAENFTIVGVIDSGAGVEAFIPSNVFELAGVADYDQAKVVLNTVENVEDARRQIESLGFQTNSLTDTLSEIDNIFRFLNLVLIGFGSIGMLVAVLGMFNTLTISLLERTKEIGLMMALGARRKDMRKLFTFEALLISFVGAVVGIVLAYIAGRFVNLALNLNAQARGVNDSFELFATPIWAVLAVVAGTMLVGWLVVYFPARRAERINPIDALRRE
jgi:putative ABC transport system permease protein